MHWPVWELNSQGTIGSAHWHAVLPAAVAKGRHRFEELVGQSGRAQEFIASTNMHGVDSRQLQVDVPGTRRHFKFGFVGQSGREQVPNVGVNWLNLHGASQMHFGGEVAVCGTSKHAFEGSFGHTVDEQLPVAGTYAQAVVSLHLQVTVPGTRSHFNCGLFGQSIRVHFPVTRSNSQGSEQLQTSGLTRRHLFLGSLRQSARLQSLIDFRKPGNSVRGQV